MADDESGEQPRSKTWYYVALVLFVLLLIGAIILVIIGFTRTNPPGPVCSSNANCRYNELCTDGYCIVTKCENNADCEASQICAYGFCYQTRCQTNDDCPDGTVCGFIASNQIGGSVNTYCTPAGATCTSAEDCNRNSLRCISGICGQCTEDDECPRGSFCGGDSLCYTSCAENPSICTNGTTCINDYCCPTGFNAINCTSTANCGANGYCVNGKCSCGAGGYGDRCTSNNDCASGNCLAGVCVNPSDECNSNYDSSTPNELGMCPSNLPYCSFGTCSTTAEGAPCSCTTYDETSNVCTEYNSCNIPVPLNATGTTGTSLSPFMYCVNNRCNLTPGWAGSRCTSDSDCAKATGANRGICNADGRCE